ncbi:hypothetical protein GCM10023196_035990 [Actinoallomurus vinaceus]|uniref:CHAD domain-containing protein n=1 Tax=Actinoallomurus vinaceus TaxID=1080074 RepID=A0ABP8UDJ9_9ACTN
MTTTDQTPAGTDVVPAGPAIARALRRARRRRRIEIWRYRLAVRVGGPLFREESLELDRLRAKARALTATWDTDIAGQQAWRDFWHSHGVHGLSNVARGRIRQLRDCADELRALLEEM